MCQVSLNFVQLEIPHKFVKYNHSVTFCAFPFFVYPPTDLDDQWFKTRGIRRGCAFSPQILDILHYESRFRSKHA